ncbi:MAG: hypothetical protein ABRQ37_22765, partial [Candidatus Eremiobacterota bacterium]
MKIGSSFQGQSIVKGNGTSKKELSGSTFGSDKVSIGSNDNYDQIFDLSRQKASDKDCDPAACLMGSETAKASDKDCDPFVCLMGSETAKASDKDCDPFVCLMGSETAKASDKDCDPF